MPWVATWPLGATIRWWLLAERSHTVREVDFLLGISNRPVVLKFMWHGLTSRWNLRLPLRLQSTATLSVAYLVVNILVRLSVAFVGLGYNLKEDKICAVMVVDFSYKNTTFQFGKFDSNAILGL